MKKADHVGGPRSPRSPSALPESDPAFPIVGGILGVIPASEWNFARIESNAAIVQRFGSHGNDKLKLAKLGDEFARQRSTISAGPRIAAVLGPLEDFASGVALIFADARTDFAILTLMLMRPAHWVRSRPARSASSPSHSMRSRTGLPPAAATTVGRCTGRQRQSRHFRS